MPAQPQHDSDALVHALVQLHRYTVAMTRIADESFGGRAPENRDLQILLMLRRRGPMTPTALLRATGAPRSTISRAVGRLERASLIQRAADPLDGRSVLIQLSIRGRRRTTAFGDRIGHELGAMEPLLKDAFHALGVAIPQPDPVRPRDPFAAAEAMTREGASFVAQVRPALAPFGVEEFSERATLALVRAFGVQRPSQIADELGLTLSGTSGVLERLELSGLIERRHDPGLGDRRAVYVVLTDRGDEAITTALAVFARCAPDLVRALQLTWRSEP